MAAPQAEPAPASGSDSEESIAPPVRTPEMDEPAQHSSAPESSDDSSSDSSTPEDEPKAATKAGPQATAPQGPPAAAEGEEVPFKKPGPEDQSSSTDDEDPDPAKTAPIPESA